MDLNSIMNESAPAPQKRTSYQASTPDGGRFMGQQQVPTPSANGIPIAGGYPPSYPESRTPSYGPPPSAHPTPAGLTPLNTPSAQPGNQYPFPTQPLRAPSEPYSAGSPVGTRTNQPYPHMSPSHYGPGGQIPTLHASHSNSSLSPTPSSHPSHTPHSVRQSPLATFSHPPGQAPNPQQQYHASQPSTPLGPPPLIHRASNPVDRTTPMHQRTLSGASSAMLMGSPAQHHLSIGSLVESPNTYHRPSSQSGRASDHHSNPDRERSVSVSPKTMVPPRLSSMGSRHSSQPELHSARSSVQPSGSIALPSTTPTPTPPVRSSHSPHDVSQAYPQASQASDPYARNGNEVPSSQRDNRTPIEYQSRKLGMNHLLSPSNPPNASPHSIKSPVDSQKSIEPSHFASNLSSSFDHHATHADLSHVGNSKQGSSHPPSTATKRPAEDQAGSEPPAKRFRKRRHQDRPVWAQRHEGAQRARRSGDQPVSQPHASHSHHNQPHVSQARQQAHHNSQKPTENSVERDPSSLSQNKTLDSLPEWRQDPPRDNELIRARNVLGRWEKSMQWRPRLSTIVSRVQDWLFLELDRYADVLNDPLEGTFEIEAKIGRLINMETGRRCDLHVDAMTVIKPEANPFYRFESQMNEAEHERMNKHLNELTRRSKDEGRVPIQYQHLYENDSFRTLSRAGIEALPPAVFERRLNRELKVRTTVEDKSGNIKARIVKLQLAHLHIYSPLDPYDCRITINFEVNMNRPGVDPDALALDSMDKPTSLDRHKDRMSYHHLAYSVDLTKVVVRGAAPKFELELELDANLLRSQIQKVKSREMHAYTDVVEGFVENCAHLMAPLG